jgi:hypothetical protein
MQVWRSGRWDKSRDSVVSHSGAPSSIPIVGAEVQVTVGARHDITNAAELPLEQAFLADDSVRRGIDSKPQQMRAAQCADEQIVRKLRERLSAIER